jgi:site-specific DNA recombinase
VDCVVVYKVDRLSRSLLDFARLMDRFDQRSVSFVSVTQHFNTTTSLGRLTLNILLSFAQFERELIGERTRDKMSAARRKGKWVGGTPVLGYDVDPRGGRLVVNEKEAHIVREIFELYRHHRSVDSVVRELARLGWKTKSWKSRRGLRHKGRFFTAISLNRLLTNAIYAGKVDYRGVIYDGEHPAIVKPELFAEINADLREPKQTKPNSVRMPQKALLAGLLFCKSCDQGMIATYSINQGVCYRYYVCKGARQSAWRSCASKSVRATLIEDSVVAQLGTRLGEKQVRLALQIPDPAWEAFLEGDRELVRALVEKIRYDGSTGSVSVKLRRLETSEIEVQP